MLNAMSSLSSVSSDVLLIDATTHSLNSISPFLSRSTSVKMSSTSFFAFSEKAPKAAISSYLPILPSPEVSRDSKES